MLKRIFISLACIAGIIFIPFIGSSIFELICKEPVQTSIVGLWFVGILLWAVVGVLLSIVILLIEIIIYVIIVIIMFIYLFLNYIINGK